MIKYNGWGKNLFSSSIKSPSSKSGVDGLSVVCLIFNETPILQSISPFELIMNLFPSSKVQKISIVKKKH